MASTLSILNKYKKFINRDDFVDYLICKKIIDETLYLRVWSKDERDRITSLFEFIDSITDTETVDTVIKYLKETYPNAEKVAEDEDKRRTTSVRGGVPGFPPNYVSRKDLVKHLKRELLALTWERRIVIHGMIGYGKSCLVNEVIRDPFVLKHFDYYVFWINLGDCYSVEYIWQHMSRLYTAANSVIENKIDQCHEDVNLLSRLLTTLFTQTKLQKALLILDNPRNEEVLSHFNFRCRTIVTSTDRKVLRNENAKYIEVNTGFSMNESLKLFKKSLGMKGDLPTQAEEIHHICQGHPMVIALIGSYLSEMADMVKGNGAEIWQYIKESVSRGNYRLNEYNGNFDIGDMVRKCIVKFLTNNDLKDKYHDLAIFEQDVNIPPAVLEVLWSKQKMEVLSIMKNLADKSLVVLFYHDELQTYIYGVHKLLLNYLKSETADSIQCRHRKLIDGYDRLTNGNYSDLPNDNYTLQFIGHHILKAGAFEKFSIFFDFKFLEAKIRASGKQDLLRDMMKYRRYITKGDTILERKMDQYEDFVERCGCNLYIYKKTDILQYALRESKDSVVFEDALRLAKVSPYLYFQLQKSVDEPDYSQTMRIEDDITCATFVDTSHHILVGTAEGKIKLFYEQSPKEISNFVGHTKAIKNLIVGPDKKHFLSISVEGIVHLWKFAAESARNSRDFSNGIPVPPDSPKTKQSYWQDMYTPDRGQIKPKAKFQAPEDDDCIVSVSFCYDFPRTYNIVTGSRRGNVTVWDAREAELICKTVNTGIEVSSVLYRIKGDMDIIVFLCEDIYIYELRNNELRYLEKFHAKEAYLSLYYCDDYPVAVVTEKSIIVWQNYTSHEVFTWPDEKKKNICSTITNDHQYLVLATNQSTVFVWDLLHKTIIREFENKGLAHSLDTIYDEEKSVHLLLIATDSHTLQLFPLQPCDNAEKPMIKSPPLATLWKRKNVLAAFETSEHCLQVFSGYVHISETGQLPSAVASACFSTCGGHIVYGLRNGEIRDFNLKTRTEVVIETAAASDAGNSSVTYLKCYDPSHPLYNKPYNSCSSTDSLDFDEYYLGNIIAITSSSIVKIYKDRRLLFKCTKIEHPTIFYSMNRVIFVDQSCKVHTWYAHTGMETWQNPHILEEVKLSFAAFCDRKSLLALSYCHVKYFLDLYTMKENQKTLSLQKRLDLNKSINSICFSSDGNLLAGGFNDGNITVWNLNELLETITLCLHSGPIENLVFSPNMENILVSLGEEIAWWNLKPFCKRQRTHGRPTSIDTLSESISSDMDISFWSYRRPFPKEAYLLSCMKLQGKAKYVSASKDFNSFLAVDSGHKVYILDIINGE